MVVVDVLWASMCMFYSLLRYLYMGLYMTLYVTAMISGIQGMSVYEI